MTTPVFPEVPVLLVDGDIIAYRAAAVAEKTHYCVIDEDSPYRSELIMYFNTAKEAKEEVTKWSAGTIWSRKEVQPVEFAMECLQSSMDAIAKRFPNAVIQVYLSGERNFRDTIWKTKKYKGNRLQERPKHLEAVRQALISRWFAVVSHNQEADDDIGIASTDRPDTVVVSTDKDLDQIPGWHYNFVKEELYWVTPEDAEQYFWEQVISGDAVDNIPGLPGYGPVKARTYVDMYNPADPDPYDLYDYQEHVWTLFAENGFDKDYFQEMMDLIRIKRQ